MSGSDFKLIEPCAAVRGQLHVAGDKSISHRLAMLGGLAEGSMRVEGYLRAEDCMHTLRAVQLLGAQVECLEDAIEITGCGGRFTAPGSALDLGNSGTGLRLLAGLLAGQPFVSELTGDDSLRSRPMRRIQAPLELMGAKVELLGANGCAPVRVHGSKLDAIRYELPVASAQVKSCVLLAGLGAEGVIEVVEPRATRDHTERLLGALGVQLEIDGQIVRMAGQQPLRLPGAKRTWRVPGDFSSAAFWLVAAACRPGSDVRIDRVGLNPRRTALLDVLQRMGAGVTVEVAPDDNWEALGSVNVHGHTLKGTVLAGEEIPNLIDELPLIGVAAAMAEGETIVRDAAELRVKESDRIKAITNCLKAFGVDVEEREDGFRVAGRGGLQSRSAARIDSMGDHRIAMCGAILALFAERASRIEGVGCVQTSYPEFWNHLEGMRA